MKKIVWFSALMLLIGTAAAADDVSVPITSGPASGTPLDNRGTCKFSESGRELLSTVWSIANVSQKSIVAYVETLTVRYSDGRTEERPREWESFFHPTVIEPGDVIPPSPQSAPPRIYPNPDSRPQDSVSSVQPSCEANARWVQFLDGTIFGEPRYGEQLIKIRQATLTALRHLDEVYKTQGVQRFDEELQKPVQPSISDAYIEHLRRFEKEHNALATVGQLETHIKVAEGRSKLLH